MRVTILVATAILVADQLSKWTVVEAMDLRSLGRIDVFPHFLTFRMAWNEGVNFGLLSNGADITRWFLIALAAVISVWVWLWVRKPGHGLAARAAAGFLIGGAIGNVIDRLRTCLSRGSKTPTPSTWPILPSSSARLGWSSSQDGTRPRDGARQLR